MAQDHSNKPTTILRIKQVKARTGLARSALYQLIAESKFPKQILLSARAVGWIEAEVDIWLSNQIAQSRPVGGNHA